MKVTTQLLTGFSIALLSACGTSNDRTTLNATPDNDVVKTDAVLSDLSVKSNTAGAPELVLEIKGQVMVGGNPCSARGRDVQIQQEQADGVITVTFNLVETPANAKRICTMEFRPVRQTVSTIVRAARQEIKDVIVKNAGALGQDQSVLGLASGDTIVVNEVKAQPINGGINPDSFALEISGKVLAGINACVAANNDVGFVQKVKGKEIHVIARRHTVDAEVMCPSDYEPVYRQITIVVFGLRSAVDKVIIENVGAIGQNVDTDKP